MIGKQEEGPNTYISQRNNTYISHRGKQHRKGTPWAGGILFVITRKLHFCRGKHLHFAYGQAASKKEPPGLGGILSVVTRKDTFRRGKTFTFPIGASSLEKGTPGMGASFFIARKNLQPRRFECPYAKCKFFPDAKCKFFG